MPGYGPYTIVRELHRTGLGCVHAAAKDGAESDVAFVVKTCRPDELVLSAEQSSRAMRAFVAAAEGAKKIGDHAECARRWAKVYAIGRAGEGEGGAAYCVTDLATIASAEKLFAGRVQLDGATLAWLVGEVVEGLRDLERHMGRGHGNLKPSNVLICGDVNKELRLARVLLCDPVVDAKPDSEDVRLADLRGVGVLIHALVLHTQFRGGWPVEQSPAWGALGGDGAKWRELVNTLLDPNPRAARPTLDELAARLVPLAVAKKSRSGMLAMAAGVLLAVGVGGAVAWHYTHREVITIVKWNEQPDKHAQEWRDLCAAYRGWYSLFQDGLGKPPTMGLRESGFATRREAYAATDPQLKQLLSLPGIAEGFDPWSIAHVARDTDLSPLANTPTDHARSDTGVDKTQAALASVEAIKKGLTDGWKAPQGLKEKAAAFRQLGWNRPAGLLEAAAGDVNPDKAPDPAVAVDSVLSLVSVVAKIDAAWAKVQESQAAIATMGDPILAKIGPNAAKIVGADLSDGTTPKRDDLLKLEKQATDAAEISEKLAEFARKEWPTIDAESFTGSAKYAAMAGAAPSVQVSNDWLKEVVNHHSLDPAADPRREMYKVDPLAALDAGAEKLTGKPLKGTMDPAVGARLAKLHEDVPALAPDKLFWKRSNKERVESETARVKGELEGVRIALDGLIEKRRAEFAAAAGAMRQRLSAKNEVAPGSAAVNTAWKAWRETMAGFKDEDYEEVGARADALADGLGKVEKSFPGAMVKTGEGVPQTDWAASLAEASAAERERRLGEVMRSLGATPPDPSGEALKSAAAGASKEYGDWVEKLTKMRGEIGKAEEATNSGVETTGPESLEAVVGKWMSDPIGKEPAIEGSISSIRERVAATKALKAEKSIDVLVGKVLNPEAGKPELTLAAWRRLGDADVGWPRTAEQMEQGARLKASLAGVISKLPQARHEPLARQLGADLSARWGRYAASVREPRAFEGAMAKMAEFSVDEGTLPPVVKYNVMLARLRAGIKPDAEDAQVVEMAGAFDKGVRGLGTEVMSAPSVAKLLKDAAPIIRSEEIVRPKVDPRTLGPAKMGGGKWQVNLDTVTADLTFTRGQTTLVFVRVAVPGPDPEAAVYLCTRELSIGDAKEILDAAGGSAWSDFKKDLPALNVWVTPRGWTLDAKGMLTTQSWMQMDSNMSPDLPGYPAGILKPGQIARVQDGAGGEPTPDSPLQEIPAYTLAYVARLAGARFPTSAEWLAAHREFDGGAVPPGANLRDQMFEQQRAHILASQSKVSRKDGFPWPDKGAFVPAGTKLSEGENARSRAGNDGVLWFAPTSVGGGARVHHLVGNVAELVVEDGPQFERAAPSAVGDVLGKVTLGVIGGSALSAPDLAVDKALPFDAGDSEGYADVGCRLAFNAAGTAPPRESFAVRMRRMLTDEAYLLGK